MHLSVYDYQAKTSRYKKGLTYLKKRETTKQNQTKNSQKLKRRRHKHKKKEKNIKKKKKKESRRCKK